MHETTVEKRPPVVHKESSEQRWPKVSKIYFILLRNQFDRAIRRNIVVTTNRKNLTNIT